MRQGEAREYFERIREEAAEISEAVEMLERIKGREGAKAQSYGAAGGGSADPMAAVDGRIDFEGRLRQRIADSWAEVDEACLVLYGRDGRGGLAKLRGSRYADVLCMAYLQAMTWGEVADVMRCSKQWCRELANAAFKAIDAVGFATLREI